jgi:hypothetical protein
MHGHPFTGPCFTGEPGGRPGHWGSDYCTSGTRAIIGFVNTKHSDREDGKRPEILWGRSRFSWDGEDLTLTVEHWFHPGPSRWLHLNLADRLEDALDDDAFRADVTGAVWYGDNEPKSGVAQDGQLQITAPKDAWSDPAELRAAVERAADEAYEESRKADRAATRILSDLLP